MALGDIGRPLSNSAHRDRCNSRRRVPFVVPPLGGYRAG
jgi:hypothetical protein